MSFSPTAQQIADMLEHIRYEITHCFVIPEHNPSDPHALRQIFSSVFMHARVLASFFEATERRSDDVLCTDYGFPAGQINLTVEHRKRFNKDMMHLTYARLRHTADTKPWPIDEIGILVGKRSYQFICHIVQNPPAHVHPKEVEKWAYMKEAFKKIG